MSERARLLRALANTIQHLLLILGGLWIVFASGYWYVEDYRLVEAMHWSMQTLTTTGYGDKPPQTDWGLVLSMLLQPASVGTTLLLGANFVKRAIEDPDAFTHEEQVQMRDDLHHIRTTLNHLASKEHP